MINNTAADDGSAGNDNSEREGWTMANRRTPAETLHLLITELAEEKPDDRNKIIGALITWFGFMIIGAAGIVSKERGDGHDG